jgi:hypothetical protein
LQVRDLRRRDCLCLARKGSVHAKVRRGRSFWQASGRASWSASGGRFRAAFRKVEPAEAKATEPAEQTIVELTVERAMLKKMDPYPWIDLKVVAGDSGEEWPGIYHIEGDKLTLAFATTRPTKLASPKVNMNGLFTRPSPISKVITLVRMPEK